jgi:hypothetical protein
VTLHEFNEHVALEVRTTIELLSKMFNIPVTVKGGAEGRMSFAGPKRGVFSGQVTWEFDADAVPEIPIGTAAKAP